ncbi:MAG: hypothetical protein ABIS18_02235 [Actinomycetota bacterium]
MRKLLKRAVKVFMVGGVLGALAGILTPPKSAQLVEPEPVVVDPIVPIVKPKPKVARKPRKPKLDVDQVPEK